MDEIREKQPKRGWPLWKKLAVAAAIFIVAVALAVGLGVGLTRGGGDDDGDDDGQDDGQDDGGDSGSGSNRTTTWKPEVGATWQIILKNPMKLDDGADITPDVDVFDLDVYDNDEDTFRTLQEAGKKVICYFSAGSYENWRSDKDDFDDADLGKDLDGWAGERWLDLNSDNVRSIMKTRIQLAASKGCDAIDPDNVDGYQNDNGLNLTKTDSINFVKFLAKEAKALKLAIGLKNAGDIIPDVLDDVDFSVNEQCVQYAECETFAAFIEADKPVFHIEYPDHAPDVTTKVANEFCSHSGDGEGTEDFSTVIKEMDLTGWVEYCDLKTYTTSVDA